MKAINFLYLLFMICPVFITSVPAYATQPAVESSPTAALSQKELDKLAEPIALYPDILLQQVLASSTFPESP